MFLSVIYALKYRDGSDLRTLNTLFFPIYFQQKEEQSIISIAFNVHTDDHIISVYLGINDTELKRQS